MTRQWVVVLHSGDDIYVYGPLADRDDASRLADFLTTQVDPARAYPLDSPVPELLLFWNRQIKGEPAAVKRPLMWPPQPGSMWQDRNGDRWICTQSSGNHPYLVCIAKQADDAAEEIWRRYGPLTFVHHIPPTFKECPF